jgi:hypothetical protein
LKICGGFQPLRAARASLTIRVALQKATVTAGMSMIACAPSSPSGYAQAAGAANSGLDAYGRFVGEHPSAIYGP